MAEPEKAGRRTDRRHDRHSQYHKEPNLADARFSVAARYHVLRYADYRNFLTGREKESLSRIDTEVSKVLKKFKRWLAESTRELLNKHSNSQILSSPGATERIQKLLEVLGYQPEAAAELFRSLRDGPGYDKHKALRSIIRRIWEIDNLDELNSAVNVLLSSSMLNWDKLSVVKGFRRSLDHINKRISHLFEIFRQTREGFERNLKHEHKNKRLGGRGPVIKTRSKHAETKVFRLKSAERPESLSLPDEDRLSLAARLMREISLLENELSRINLPLFRLVNARKRAESSELKNLIDRKKIEVKYHLEMHAFGAIQAAA